MILECPSCGTYYDTPAVIPPEGRKVRCAKCGNAWLAAPSPSDANEALDEHELAEPAPDDAALAGQADREPDESVASDEPAGEEVSDEVAAEEETQAEIIVEAEEPELTDEAAVAAIGALVEAALDAERGESGEAVAASPESAKAASQGNETEPEPLAEDDDRALDGEAEISRSADEEKEPEEEPPPPEADYPIGDFSHQGTGPARSPMQEILTSAADAPAAQPAPDQAGPQAAAEGEQPQPVEHMGSGGTVVAVPAVEQDGPEVSSLEPVSASESEGDGSTPANETEPAAMEPEADAAEEAAIADQPAAAAQVSTDQDFQPSTRQLVSWAMLAVLVVAGFTLAVVNREAVVRSMPGTASFYSGLGMTVNLRGLDFENVTSTWTKEADQPVLEVNGEIVNITDGPMQVPAVVFELHDENGVEVHQWEAEVTKDPLEAGQRTEFTARIPSPPSSSRSVQVKFARAP